MRINLKNLAQEVIKYDASDLHLKVGHPPIARVKGKLVYMKEVDPLQRQDVEEFLKLMVGEKAVEKVKSGVEQDFAYSFSEKLRFRVNAFLTRSEVAIVMRYLPAEIWSIEELNLPSVLHKFSEYMQGFVLVTGPVGSGKSTTLASLVDEINEKRQENIITIEDPIEFLHTPKECEISQREVGRDTQTFASGLTSAFREDVDVLLVGEMRDFETMRTAVTAAETGHVVFSTLHTNSASQSINRIIDTYPGRQQGQVRSQLAQSLKAVVSQRLIPTVDGNRIPAVEVLIMNQAVSRLIREDKIYQIDTIIETHSRYGMVTMNHSIQQLVQSGQVSYETALRYSPNSESLRKMMSRDT
jgi:twitching motility protein PilT